MKNTDPRFDFAAIRKFLKEHPLSAETQIRTSPALSVLEFARGRPDEWITAGRFREAHRYFELPEDRMHLPNSPRPFLRMLVKAGLLQEYKLPDRGGDAYRITERGLEFLK